MSNDAEHTLLALASEIFNLAALKPAANEGFRYMLVVKPDSRLDHLEWREKADPEGTKSRYALLPRKNEVLDGEAEVVLFKTAADAEAFAAATNVADKDIGVIQLAREGTSPDAEVSLRKPPDFLKLCRN
jgi:hypothetical protein